MAGQGDDCTGCLLNGYSTRLCLFQKLLWVDSNRVVWRTSTWCWSKFNTANQFYWKSTVSRNHDNVFHYW